MRQSFRKALQQHLIASNDEGEITASVSLSDTMNSNLLRNDALYYQL